MDQAIADRRLKPGQLVIVDEASLAGTFALDELVGAARQAGSKILLVGDGAQLGSVEAGGAFSLLVKDRGDLVAELTDVRRFSSEWEKAASIELRSATRPPSMTTRRTAASQKAPGSRCSMPSTPPGRKTSMPASRA